MSASGRSSGSRRPSSGGRGRPTSSTLTSPRSPGRSGPRASASWTSRGSGPRSTRRSSPPAPPSSSSASPSTRPGSSADHDGTRVEAAARRRAAGDGRRRGGPGPPPGGRAGGEDRGRRAGAHGRTLAQQRARVARRAPRARRLRGVLDLRLNQLSARDPAVAGLARPVREDEAHHRRRPHAGVPLGAPPRSGGGEGPRVRHPVSGRPGQRLGDLEALRDVGVADVDPDRSQGVRSLPAHRRRGVRGDGGDDRAAPRRGGLRRRRRLSRLLGGRRGLQLPPVARLILALLVLAGPVRGGPRPVEAASPWVAELQVWFARYHENPARLDAIRAGLEHTLAAEPDLADLLALAQVSFIWGDVRARTAAQKLEAYDHGREAARRAVSRAPRNAAAHFWLATNTARWGQTKGI